MRLQLAAKNQIELDWFIDNDVYLAVKIDDQEWLEPRNFISKQCPLQWYPHGL